MKSSGSFLTRSSRKRIACSLPSAPAGTGRAAGTVIDDEFDGADERPLPQPAPDRRERQRDRKRERRRDGGTEGWRDGGTGGRRGGRRSAKFLRLSVSPSLRLSVSPSLRPSIDLRSLSYEYCHPPRCRAAAAEARRRGTGCGAAR